jgi:hypothetical protein
MIPTQKKSSEVGADGSPLNTEGQKRAIADQGGTSNPPTIGRSSQEKSKEITMKESTQTANALVRGANLDTSMMYVGSICRS